MAQSLAFHDPETLDTAIALEAAGLTLSAQLVNTTGANVGSAVTTGFVDLGGGMYLWHYAAFPDGHRGAVKFSSGGVLKAIAPINPEEAENTDAKTSTRAATDDSRFANLDAPVSSRATSGNILLPAARVNYVGPVVANGNVTLLQGDDYANADGRALVFTEDGAGWPTLTSATVRLKSRHKHGMGQNLDVIGTVVTATGTSKSVRFDLTTAQTGALGPRDHHFDIEATLTTSRVVTLHRGNLFVLDQA